MNWNTLLLISVYLISYISCQKTQMTRTALHVARSLDPESMEEMSVKTKSGDMATIIVKRRNGKFGNFTDFHENRNETADHFSLISVSENLNNNNNNSNNNNNINNNNINNTNQVDHAKTIRNIYDIIDMVKLTDSRRNESNSTTENKNYYENGTNSRGGGRALVPEPVSISSSAIFVKEQNPPKKGRSLLRIDPDGIPVITGIRVPDDESDKQIWRNARVINGMLVPYDKFDNKHKPTRKPATTHSPTFSTTSPNEDDSGWLKIGAVTKKPTKILPIRTQPPKDEWKKTTKAPWYSRNSTADSSNLVNNGAEAIILHTIEDDNNYMKTTDANSYKQHPLGLWIPEENPVNSDETYVADKILDYIKHINKEEIKRLASHGFGTRDARMMDEPHIQSRILHPVGDSVFPNSALYSPSTPSQPSQVSFEEAVRTPVLQYAHPEYGVQSAKSPPVIEGETNADLTDDEKYPTSVYYDRDVYSDRSPFFYEPGFTRRLENDDTKRAYTGNTYQRPKKTLGYFYPEKTTVPNSPNKYYSKYPYKDNYKSPYPAIMYYNSDDIDGRPFWIRIGDTLKESVQTGLEKVSDLTKPVVDPIVEATNKISHNLGLSSTRDLSTIREKLGSVSTSSLILPAIGIVAGGAALGLGAVAVGRYLNYDVVRMRSGKSLNEGDLSGLSEEEIQSMWADDDSRSPRFGNLTDTTTEAENKNNTRTKRSVKDELHSEKYLHNILQNLEESSTNELSPDNYPSSVWNDTPCSKKIFCDTLLSQSEDFVLLMEKKIIAFLTRLPQDLAMAVSPHLEDVMSAVRTGNCSKYTCNKSALIQQDSYSRHNSRKTSN